MFDTALKIVETLIVSLLFGVVYGLLLEFKPKTMYAAPIFILVVVGVHYVLFGPIEYAGIVTPTTAFVGLAGVSAGIVITVHYTGGLVRGDTDA